MIHKVLRKKQVQWCYRGQKTVIFYMLSENYVTAYHITDEEPSADNRFTTNLTLAINR